MVWVNSRTTQYEAEVSVVFTSTVRVKRIEYVTRSGVVLQARYEFFAGNTS